MFIKPKLEANGFFIYSIVYKLEYVIVHSLDWNKRDAFLSFLVSPQSLLVHTAILGFLRGDKRSTIL